MCITKCLHPIGALLVITVSHNSASHIGAILQRDVPLKDWDGHEALPVFLTRLYQFFETRIGQTPLLFMSASQTAEHTPAEIRKHLDLAKPGFDGIVVYSAERLTSGFRARLIAAASPSPCPAISFLFRSSQRTCANISGHRSRSGLTNYRHRLNWFCFSTSSKMTRRDRGRQPR